MSFLPSRLDSLFRRWKEGRGVSQKQIAAETGLSESAVINYRRGDQTPGAEQLYRLAQFFSVPMESFFSTAEKKTGTVQELPSPPRQRLTKKELREARRQIEDVVAAVFQKLEE